MINKNLKQLAQATEISKPLSLHISRHSFADIARKRGANTYDISKALAHSSIKVTESYLASMDEESFDKTMSEVLDFKYSSLKTKPFLRLLREAQKYLFEPGEFHHFHVEFKTHPPCYFEQLEKIYSSLSEILELIGVSNSKLNVLSIILLEYIYFQSRFMLSETESSSTSPYIATGSKALLLAMKIFDQSPYDVERIIIETKVISRTSSDDHKRKSLETIKNERKYKPQKHIISEVDTLNLIFSQLNKTRTELTLLSEIEGKNPVKHKRKTTYHLRASKAHVRKLFAKSIMRFFESTKPLLNLSMNEKYRLGVPLCQTFQISHFTIKDNKHATKKKLISNFHKAFVSALTQ